MIDSIKNSLANPNLYTGRLHQQALCSFSITAGVTPGSEELKRRYKRVSEV